MEAYHSRRQGEGKFLEEGGKKGREGGLVNRSEKGLFLMQRGGGAT